MRRHARQSPLRAILAALLATGFLLALFVPTSEPENHRLILDPSPALEIVLIAIALALLALSGLRLNPILRGALAVAIFLTALLHLADALMPALFGRELDLYWDLGFVPALLGLFIESAGWWRGGLTLVAAGGGVVITLALITASLWAIERAAARRGGGTALALPALAILAVGGAALPHAAGATAPFSTQLSREITQQGRFLYRAWQVSRGNLGPYAATLATPQRTSADLAGLKHRDVLLIYFESYGTVALDNPEYRVRIEPALSRFEAKIGDAGYTLLANRIVSPTFGGGSWLAHGTMASGVKLDQFLSRLLLETDRRSLPSYMAAAGYRTVNVMPGIKKPWPESRFWGFDKSYYASDLDYRGPEFGWFGIPDQYTLKKFATRENHADGRPLFAEIVLVSSHTPFYPVPPYSPHWADAGDYNEVTPETWERIYRQPDWNSLKEPYLDSITYDLDVLGDFLATRVADGALVIILGDHQPPAFISGEKQPWTVPIYVASKDPELVAPFAARGYTPGALPAQAAPRRGMESFLGDFLDAFSGPAPLVADQAASKTTSP